jgi:hypothetical protein
VKEILVLGGKLMEWRFNRAFRRMNWAEAIIASAQFTTFSGKRGEQVQSLIR